MYEVKFRSLRFCRHDWPYLKENSNFRISELSQVTCFNTASDGTGQFHLRVCLRLSCGRVAVELRSSCQSHRFEFRHAFSFSDAGLNGFPSRLRKMLE